jgi:antitoxin (DNA-binding transcriptional repressor) of toxin-antitoxin stability system
MVTANMHEAKTRLSELVKLVEERDEVVVLCRNGKPVAEIRKRHDSPQLRRNLDPDPKLRPILAPGYDPSEPLSSDEWPEELK